MLRHLLYQRSILLNLNLYLPEENVNEFPVKFCTHLFVEKERVELGTFRIAGLLSINSLLATPAPDNAKSLGELNILIASNPIENKLDKIIILRYFFTIV